MDAEVSKKPSNISNRQKNYEKIEKNFSKLLKIIKSCTNSQVAYSHKFSEYPLPIKNIPIDKSH